MRQIVLDTETTGIGSELGHRIIEIGCMELINRKLTGNHYHVYLNPEREIDAGAFRVHGIGTAFLQDKPLFKDQLPAFLKFIENAELIIHNAPFDLGFLNAELKRAKWPNRLDSHCTVFDTLVMARNKHPGQRNSLDALCKRYDVDNTKRLRHGALLDAEILAFVYLAMTGGQAQLFLEEEGHGSTSSNPTNQTLERLVSESPVVRASGEELERHAQFTQFLSKKSGKSRFD